MNENVREKDAKQGRSGKQVLIVMVVSMVLLIGIYLVYNLFASAPADSQAVAPTGQATTEQTGAGTTVVPEGGTDGNAETVTVPDQQEPALATGAEETPAATEGTTVVTPETAPAPAD